MLSENRAWQPWAGPVRDVREHLNSQPLSQPMTRHFIVPAVLVAFLAPTAGLAEDSHALDPDAWPRSYKVGSSEFAIYMPQIVEWKEYRHVKATAAIGIKLDGAEEATFGAATIEADTVADFDHRRVSLGQRKVESIRFPELDAGKAARAEQLLLSVITPTAPLDIPLDAMLAAVDRADAVTSETKVNFEPPPIYHSETPAILVTFIGEPKLKPATAGNPALMFAINTNWDVLFDAPTGSYYLLAESRWLVTQDLLKPSWTPATRLPASFHKLPDDGNWSEVKAKLFIVETPQPPPAVFTSQRPAEIILTDGVPQMGPIQGTGLLYVINTESDLFYDFGSETYYFLTSGRWFSAPKLEGPWAAATHSLPDDFRKIPTDHPKAHALASVPGTPAADEAVIQASIPQTATVSRADTTVQVVYDGEPEFKPVPGAEGVSFAVNTSHDVFLVSGKYYCCEQGVWFDAPTPTGKWVVCDNVPDPIYTIPPESPKHNVTYVNVYESNPETVVVGTTSGYSGSYIADGLLVFGLGYWLGKELAEDYWYGPYYPKPYWYGYGCGAYYRPGYGYYRRGAYAYGPYGGAGFGTAYNPRTGAYARGAYAYGPYRSAGAAVAYNPWTRTGAAHAGASGPYGSWGRSAVVRDDQWVRTAHRSNPYGSAGAIQGSRGGAAVGVNRTYGSDAFAARTGSGDVYVGRDGNIYKKGDDGWQKRQDGGWQGAPEIPRATPYSSAPRGTGRSATRDSARPITREAVRPTTRDSSRSATRSTGYSARSSNTSHLSRSSYSRSRSSSGTSRSSRGRRGGRRR